VFALYFCFLDGGYLTALIKKAIPIEKQKMTVLTTKFADITRNLFSGYILVALYQGLASLIIMLIFRVDGALLLSVLLMFASFIPIVGAAIVWLPVGIVLCVSKSMFIGILFIIICGFCVSFLDNFLRPFFLKDRIKVHPLVIFFAILGGISVFGLNGLLLGPIIVILFFSVLDMIVGEKN
jgi:predicted PurR-regulated permease PerM